MVSTLRHGDGNVNNGYVFATIQNNNPTPSSIKPQNNTTYMDTFSKYILAWMNQGGGGCEYSSQETHSLVFSNQAHLCHLLGILGGGCLRSL